MVTGIRLIASRSGIVSATGATLRALIKRRTLSRAFGDSTIVMTRWKLGPRLSDGAGNALVNSSGFVWLLERLFGFGAAGWRTSISRRLFGQLLESLSRSHAVGIRLIGWIFFGAITTKFFMEGMPAILTVPTMGLGWIIAIPCAAACILKPTAVLAAWERSGIRRYLNSLLRPGVAASSVRSPVCESRI